ncbi:ABC transporter substrate-binding protein [Rhodopila sp.]|jgi:NitT/TauT family transport system substrate-binding protein|uniref:ABC transporter substrate-binding protein n=1 Tax=Rhodopila sp. TaxID=2480087 RepID=UPI002B7A9678|nr:ABC transporter substrate-binding protein [Rhodopila sp.]HVZ08732.1 ABC transporter substrate-binding protein [Rhodopila sp.]
MRRTVAALLAALSMTCAGTCAGVTARAEVPEVRIARQFSMGYLQFNVIDHEKLIQKHAAALGIPDVKVSLLRFNGPSVMNDGLLSDTVDLVGGSPNGMFSLWAKARNTPQEVRAITALVTLPFALTTNDPEVKSLADIGKCKKIPVPSLKVSSPAVFVQLAAAKLYGIKEFARFDPATVVMSPADATIALLTGSGDINCVVALPPYLQQQLQDPKIRAVASSFELTGPTTYTVAYTTRKFHDRNPKLFQAVFDALTEATDRVRADIRTASRYWIEDSDSKLSVDFVADAGTKNTEWTTVPMNTLKQAEFMAEIGTLKVKPTSWKDYFFPEAYGLPGS